MANQQAPRQWFRLASISRPAPQEPTPTPEPTPALPRTTTIRPAFRPVGGTSSVPTSPVSGGRASQPSSPLDKKSQVTPTTASVPNSPVKTASTAAKPTTSPPKQATTSSLPSSPAKPVAASTTSVSSSTAKPVATTASVTTSPAKKVPSIASVPISPVKTAATTVSVPSAAKTAPTTSMTSPPTQKPSSFMNATTTRAPSPKASIPTVKPVMQSPVQSPQIKATTAPPPSPLTLPPAQLRPQAELEPKIPVEAEQKTVLVQKMVEKPRGLFAVPQKDDGGDSRHPSNHGPKDSSKYGETKGISNGKKLSSDSEDSGTRVITIAGENKGAFLELIRSSPHKNGFQGSPHRLQKMGTGSDGSDYHSYSSSSSSEEGDRKTKSNGSKSNTMPMNAYMNSNVQGVNNSIVYNSSYTHHDPGVHLSLHRKPTASGFHVKERSNGYNS